MSLVWYVYIVWLDLIYLIIYLYIHFYVCCFVFDVLIYYVLSGFWALSRVLDNVRAGEDACEREHVRRAESG